jgi:hypothetical protein
MATELKFIPVNAIPERKSVYRQKVKDFLGDCTSPVVRVECNGTSPTAVIQSLRKHIEALGASGRVRAAVRDLKGDAQVYLVRL